MSLLALLGCGTAACAALLRRGWREQGAVRVGAAAGAAAAGGAAMPSLARAAFASGMADVSAEVRDALLQMAEAAGRHLVQLEMAVPPDLAVRTDLPTLRAVLRALVDHAIRQAPGGRVLLSARRLGGRVQIAVADDGAGAAAPVQESALREILQAVALQGGTVEIEVLADEGTTISVCLREPMPHTPVAPTPPTPAKPAAAVEAASGAQTQTGAEALCWEI